MARAAEQRLRSLLAGSALGVLVLVGGCVDDKRLTVSEARQVALSLRGQAAQVAPRKVEDVVARFAAPVAEPDGRAEIRTRLAQPAKAGAVADHFSRAHAAWEVGLYAQARAEMAQTLALASEGTTPPVARVRLDLARMEMRTGNYARGAEMIEGNADGAAGAGEKVSAAMAQARRGSLDAAWNNAEEVLRGLEGARYLDPAVAAWRPLWLGDIKGIQATVLEVRGRPQEGESYRRQAVAQVAEAEAKPDNPAVAGYVRQARVSNALALAANLRQQGRLAEAEYEVRQGIDAAVAGFGGESAEVVGALAELERVLTAQGRLAEAGTVVDTALGLAIQTGYAEESLVVGRLRNRSGEIAAARGDWAQSVAHFDAAGAAMAADQRSYDLFLAVNPTRAIAIARASRLDQAEAIAQVALRHHRDLLGEDSFDAAESLGVLALVHAMQRRDDVAAGEFARAFAGMERFRPRSEADAPADRQARLAAMIDVYLDLSLRRDGVDQGKAAETLRVAEMGRNRTLARSMAAAAVRGGIGTPELRDLVRQEQDAGRESEAMFALLSAGGTVDAEVQGRLRQVQAARAVLLEEIARRFPAFGELVDPRPPSAAQVSAALHPGEALVAIRVGAGRSHVWALSPSGRMQVAEVPLAAAEVERLVRAVRAPMEVSMRDFDTIPAFDVAAAHALYAAFLEPVRAGWGDARFLTVVVDGALASVPFSLLPTAAGQPERRAGEPLFAEYRRVPWLFRTHAVATVPSVAALVALRTQPHRTAPRPLAAFADPLFSPSRDRGAAVVQRQAAVVQRRPTRAVAGGTLDSRAMTSARLSNLVRLEETADEARGIARAMGADETRDVFLGLAASEAQVKATPLADRRVVVFATHGLVAGDLDGLLQPALALTNPALAGGDGDGLLTMAEVLDLHLNADWVVLSACNTAAADGQGAEAVTGLGRAFFYAGSRAVLATHWAVESESARAITTRLFREYGDGIGRAEALRRVMVALVDDEGVMVDGRVYAAYAHPLFWAPFALFGDGG